MKRTVIDKHGTKYQLEALYDEYGIHFNLRCNHQPAGYANIVIQGPQQWLLADLLIYEDSIIPRPSWICLIRNLVGREPKTRSFRGHGLATVLLQCIIGEAREYGVRLICGTVHHRDRMQSSFLVQWCAKHGFREVSRKPGHPRNNEVAMELIL